MAMIQARYSRATEDIDFLVETTPENEARVIQSSRPLLRKAPSWHAGQDARLYGRPEARRYAFSLRRICV